MPFRGWDAGISGVFSDTCRSLILCLFLPLSPFHYLFISFGPLGEFSLRIAKLPPSYPTMPPTSHAILSRRPEEFDIVMAEGAITEGQDVGLLSSLPR